MSEEAQPEFVTYNVVDGVAWVMLNRPQYGNAQNYRLLGQLDDAFKRAVEDDGVKVIVLGGEGKHFSAGHDIGTPDKDSHMPRTRTSTSPCLAWAGAAASAVPMAPIAATIIIFFKCMSFLHP